MKQLIYLCCIFWLILFGSCSSKKEVTKHLDLSQVSKVDSTFAKQEIYTEGSFLDRYIMTYDSIITHIIVIRYDTAQSPSGEPIVKERIEVEQIQIKKGEEEMQSGDSIRNEVQTSVEVAKNDSLDIEQTIIGKTKKPSFSVLVLVVLLVLVIGAVMVVLAKNDSDKIDC